MAFRAAETGVAGSNNSTSATVVVPAAAQVGDVLTVAVMKTMGGLDPFSISSSNGGTFEALTPVSGIGIPGSGNGRYTVWRRTVVAGDAGSTITVSHGASGRYTLGVHVASGVGPLADVTVLTSPTLTTSTHTLPAATPAVGSSGGTAVYFVATQINSATPTTFTSADITLRGQESTTAASGANSALAIGDEAFPNASPVATQLVTANQATNNRVQITVLYSGEVAQPPLVNAGPDRVVTVGQPFSIAATVSDPDGTIAGLLWTKVSGPTVSISGTTTNTLSGTAPASPGVAVFQLTATDNDGGTGSDTVSVTFVAAGQIARPSVDVVSTGLTRIPAGGASYASAMGDASDATGVQLATGSVAAVDLQPLAPSASDTGWVLSIRMSRTADLVSASLDVTLEQNGVTIASATFTPTAAVTTYTLTLTEAQAQTIPDRSQPLRVTIDNVTVA